MRFESRYVGTWDLRSGVQHSTSVLLFAVPCAVAGLLLATLPTCLAAVWAGEDVLQALDGSGRNETASKIGFVSLDHYAEGADFRGSGLELRPFFGMAVSQELVAGVSGAFGFGLIALRSMVVEDRQVYRRVLAVVIAEFVVLSSLGLLLQFMHLTSLLDLTDDQQRVIRLCLGAVVWALIQATLFTSLFPKKLRVRIAILFAALLLGACIAHGIWRTVASAYFSMQDQTWRICFGIVGPSFLFAIAFETFLPLAILMHEHWGLHSAVLMAIAPVSFGVGMSSVVQFGSTDFASGLCIEVGSLLLELSFKFCLISGQSPLQRCIDRAHIVHRKASSFFSRKDWLTKASSITPWQAEPTLVGVSGALGESASSDHGVDQQCTELPCADSNTQSKATIHLTAEKAALRQDLLTVVAMHANIVDVVVHMMSAGFYILALVNPNESAAPPVPPSRVTALLFMKLGFEIVTDIVLASRVACNCCGTFSGCSYSVIASSSTSQLQWDVGILAVFFAMDAQTFLPRFLCPHELGERALGDVGKLYGLQRLLSIGLCK